MDKLSIEDVVIEMAPRYAVFTADLFDQCEPECAYATDSVDDALGYMGRELADEHGKPIVYVIDTHTGLEVRFRQPRKLVVRKAQLQGHTVRIVEVA